MEVKGQGGVEILSGFRHCLHLYPRPVESWLLVSLAVVYTLGFCAYVCLYPCCPFPVKPNLGLKVLLFLDVCSAFYYLSAIKALSTHLDTLTLNLLKPTVAPLVSVSKWECSPNAPIVELFLL